MPSSPRRPWTIGKTTSMPASAARTALAARSGAPPVRHRAMSVSPATMPSRRCRVSSGVSHEPPRVMPNGMTSKRVGVGLAHDRARGDDRDRVLRRAPAADDREPRARAHRRASSRRSRSSTRGPSSVDVARADREEHVARPQVGRDALGRLLERRRGRPAAGFAISAASSRAHRGQRLAILARGVGAEDVQAVEALEAGAEALEQVASSASRCAAGSRRRGAGRGSAARAAESVARTSVGWCA